MRLKSFTFLAVLCASVAACDSLLEEEKEEDETPTPTNTNTPNPTATVAPTPVTTTVGDITTIDWGTIALDAGESPHFDFTAPAGTISIDFMAIGGPADQAKIFGFFSLTFQGPPVRTILDNGGGGAGRQAFAEAAMSFSVPSDDSAATAAAAGPWRFHVFAADLTDYQPSDPRVLVKIRTAPAGVPVGEIDVNVIVVEGVGPGITATQACTPGNSVYDGIADASLLYDANLGLTISAATLQCFDLTGSTAYTDINGQDELGDLFATSSGLADERINLFIVDSFSGDLGFAAGVAGSVPVPMQMNGTRRSGVAIQYSANTTIMAETIAHEMGHSLGLYHTSEFDAATNGFDPISDTVTCPTLPQPPYGGGCPDDTNVMFPSLTGSFTGFSAGQGTVMAPAVHVRRQGVSAFAPAADWVRTPHERVWSGPPLHCTDGVVRGF